MSRSLGLSLQSRLGNVTGPREGDLQMTYQRNPLYSYMVGAATDFGYFHEQYFISDV